MPQHSDANRPNTATVGEPGRVRLLTVRVTPGPGGTGRVDVELAGAGGTAVLATAEVEPSAPGVLKAAAGATLHALGQSTAAARGLTLGGVKCVRAFDESVVLVRVVRAAGPGPVRLVGAAVADPERAEAGLARAAVLAVLNATNRVVSGPDRA